MLNYRLLENKRAVVLYSTETPIVILSSNEWSLMEKVLRLLQPFEEYTKLMSKNNSCISEVIPAVTVLKKFLSRDDEEKTAGVRTMRDDLSTSLEKRFQTTFVNKNYVLATIVDPRFKTKFVRGDDRTALVDEVCRLKGSSDDVVGMTENVTTQEKSRNAGPHQDLWSCFDEIVGLGETSDSTSNHGSRDVEEEVNAFLSLPLQPLQACPYVWWQVYMFTPTYVKLRLNI